MTRDEILAAARQCVSVDRAATYGDARRNLANVARLWTGYNGNTYSADDVAVMLALLKIGRHIAAPTHADNMVDAIGYLSLAGELSTTVDMDKITT
jgi:hypothetical protein